jgi:hypothetical protein
VAARTTEAKTLNRRRSAEESWRSNPLPPSQHATFATEIALIGIRKDAAFWRVNRKSFVFSVACVASQRVPTGLTPHTGTSRIPPPPPFSLQNSILHCMVRSAGHLPYHYSTCPITALVGHVALPQTAAQRMANESYCRKGAYRTPLREPSTPRCSQARVE